MPIKLDEDEAEEFRQDKVREKINEYMDEKAQEEIKEMRNDPKKYIKANKAPDEEITGYTAKEIAEDIYKRTGEFDAFVSLVEISNFASDIKEKLYQDEAVETVVKDGRENFVLKEDLKGYQS